MKNCKNYTIFKFNNSFIEKDMVESLERAKQFIRFKQDFISTFSRKNFEELRKYSTSLLSPFDIGMDMIYEDYNVKEIRHGDNGLYYAIPKVHIVMTEWFELNKPDWVAKIKKI